MPRQHHLLVLGLILLLLVLAFPAAALAHKHPTGVHVDPGSPAAKEYSIPLSSARGAPAGSANSGQLFGAGITKGSGGGGGGSSTSGGAAASAPSSSGAAPVSPPSGAAVSSHPAASAHHRSRHHRASARHRSGAPSAASPAAGALAADSAPASLKVLHPSSGSGVAWMLGVAALVLILGGLGAFALRGRSRRADPRLG